jgi:hypothetical protein
MSVGERRVKRARIEQNTRVDRAVDGDTDG